MSEIVSNNDRVIDALNKTFVLESDHYDRTFRGRLNPKLPGSKLVNHATRLMTPGMVSFISQDIIALDAELRRLDWAKYEHPAIMDGCSAFVAYLPLNSDWTAHVGVVPLDVLDDENDFEVIRIEENVKSGTLRCTVELLFDEWTTSYTQTRMITMILGKAPKTDDEIVYTFHPGDPVTPGILTLEMFHAQFGEDSPLPREVTVSQAAILGFKNALLIR